MSKKNILKINQFSIFFYSILICIIFYYCERFLGIDQFYHPDSLYYLTRHEKLFSFGNPVLFINTGYHYLSRIFDYNYLYLIILNFFIFGLTNVMVFNLVFKNNSIILTKFQILILSIILFFDPFRLHLTGHVLKETTLIFLILSFLYFKNIFIKMAFLFMSIFIKKNIIFYYLIFYLDDLIKKSLNIKKKIYLILISIFLIIFVYLFFSELDIFKDQVFFWGKENKSLFNFFTNSNLNLMETLENWHYRDMAGKDYDKVPNFQNISFPLALIYKITTWPILIFSGIFLFFTNSFLFKILGFMMIYFNAVIFYITKKTYMNIGLLVLLILLSLYSTTFTSYFRYSYVAIYCAIVFFFSNLSKCQKK